MSGGGAGKGVIAGALVAAPVTAAILWFVLLRTDQIDTRQDLEGVKQEIQRERFDARFDRAWDALGGTTPAAAPDNERIRALEARRAELEAQLRAGQLRVRQEMDELERQIQQANEARARALQGAQ